MAAGIATLGRRAYRRFRRRYRRGREDRQRARVEAILARPEPPRPLDEAAFAGLQAQHKPRNGYGYGAFEGWWRGARRASWLIPLARLEQPGARIFEAACGDGMTGYAFASYRHRVTLHDLEDWRDDRAKELPFVAGDLGSRLPLEPESFDFLFSYNAFEHINDPGAALGELVRLCRKGGIIYLDFGPLYAGPWGLHAYSSLYMPYPQYLFAPEFVARKLRELGLRDLGRERAELQPLNRWTVAQFERSWRDCGCEILATTYRDETGHLSLIERFPEAFQGRGLTYRDLVTDQVAVTLRKPGP